MSKHHHSEVGPHNQFDQSIHQKLIKGLTKMNEYVHRISHNYRIGRWFVTFFYDDDRNFVIKTVFIHEGS